MKIVRNLILCSAIAPAVLLPTTALAQTAVPAVKKHLYEDDANARMDIAAAVKQAKREHKRVLVDFGGNWCGDCQVLDIYFHQQPNEDLLTRYYVVAHVSVGPEGIDKNLDIPASYGINIKKGVPALAVLDANGKVVYAQPSGEFENMRHMQSSSVTDFLNKWKA